jgi:hypothetical protein
MLQGQIIMQLSKKEVRTVKNSISSWVDDKIITQEMSETLLGSYEITHFDWKRVLQSIHFGLLYAASSFL